MKKFDLKSFQLEGVNLLEASAGTGKTFTISLLFLRLILEKGLRASEILVVTFTKAATTELRDRLRGRLLQAQAYLLKGEADDAVMREIVDAASQNIHRDVLAARVSHALQTFDDAAIFTIHGFCQKVLKNNALLAKGDFEWRLSTEPDALQNATSLDFWRRCVLPNKSWAHALQALELFPEHQVWKKVLTFARNPSKISVTWPSFSPLLQEDIDRIQAYLRTQEVRQFIEFLNDCAEKKKTSGNTVKDVLLFQKAYEAWLDLKPDSELASVAAALLPSTLPSKMKKAYRNFEIPSGFEDLETWYQRTQDSSEKCRNERLAIEALKDFYRQAAKLYAAQQEVLGEHSYDDLLYDLLNALRSSNAKELIGALQYQYRAALIDEFQDTDAVQYEIFKRIFVDNPHGFVCFVGDPKQAIYRFRGADLSTYLKAREDVEPERRFTLAKNYRSTAGVLEEVNKIFGVENAFANPQIRYFDVECGNTAKQGLQQKGCAMSALALHHLEGTSRTQLGDLPWEYLGQRIVTLLNDETIQLDGRRLQAKDLAVLIRKKDDIARAQQVLRRYGIESRVIANESIFDSTDAQEILSVLRAALQPSDVRAVKSALATRLMGIDAQTVMAIGENEDPNEPLKTFSAWYEKFSAWRQEWRRLGAGWLIAQIVREFGYVERVLGADDGARRLANYEHLLEILHEMSARYRRPETLFEQLNNAKGRQIEEEDENALRLQSDENQITIMTYHKSKGLEFPVVFLPQIADLTYKPPANKSNQNTWFEDCVVDGKKTILAMAIRKNEAICEQQKEEALRLFYVAITRASRRVEVFELPEAQSKEDNRVSHSLFTLDVRAGWTAQTVNAEVFEVSAEQIQSAKSMRLVSESSSQDWVTLPSVTPRHETWQMSSYSGLARAMEKDNAHLDDTVYSPQSNAAILQLLEKIQVPSGDALFFPRGAIAGEALHQMLEKVDFAYANDFPSEVVLEVLEGFFPSHEGLPLLAHQAEQMLTDVIGADLGSGWSLRSIDNQHRLSEMEFLLHIDSMDCAAKLLERIRKENKPGYDLSGLDAETVLQSIKGYMKGFIDLVFERDGRYYVLDWKSNFLNFADDSVQTLEDFLQQAYGQSSLAVAIQEHAYSLQYLLYTVALHRLLKLRLPCYAYEEHVGGVFYLFLRGVRNGLVDPNGQPTGVWFDLPDRKLIEDLDAILAQGAKQ